MGKGQFIILIHFQAISISNINPSHFVSESGKLIAEAYFEDSSFRCRPREGVVLLLKLAIKFFVICEQGETDGFDFNEQELHIE